MATPSDGLDNLVKVLVDSDAWIVRRAVANQGYGLDKLVNDEKPIVRIGVAYQGYALDKLINDEHGYVRNAVEMYLLDHNLTLEEWISRNPDKCVLAENQKQQGQKIKPPTKEALQPASVTHDVSKQTLDVPSQKHTHSQSKGSR